jgi:elongation factor 1-alpha
MTTKEYNVAVVGEVDAGKSTLIGCLRSGISDNGRGSARAEVLTLQHEKISGRTSNINTHMVRFGDNDIRFLDLAGHEKYLNTTMQGLTRFKPHLAILAIAANRNVTEMTREHFKVCFSLQIPIIICVTKVDITPPNVLKETLQNIKRLTKVRSFKIFTYDIKDVDTLGRALQVFNDSESNNARNIISVFQISNVTGDRTPLVIEFLSKVQINEKDDGLKEFMQKLGMRKLFIVYKPYYKNGIGYIVFGINRGEPIKVDETLLLGPVSGIYHSFRVRSIRDAHDQPLKVLETGQSGCLAVKFKNFAATKHLMRRTIVTDIPHTCREVMSKVFIFNHHSTIMVGYNPYLHCNNVATSATVAGIYEDRDTTDVDAMDDTKLVEKKLVRTDDSGYIRFTFPTGQFIYPGAILLFRENGTKGIGRVITAGSSSSRV